MNTPSAKQATTGQPLRNLQYIAEMTPLVPTRLAHVVLRCINPAVLREWYLLVLQARVSYENEMVCFLTYDDEHHRIGLVQIHGLQTGAAPSPGLEHVAFTYENLGMLLANYRRLKEHGIEPYWTINHGPTISMYYRDPEGNKVELQVEVFATVDEINQFLARYYPENFMGIIFEPEEMIQKFEAGTPLEELVRRPLLPAGMTPWDMHRP
jgi:catechol 2,3-dioxygenase-like lactoylglutathione lyase family enzyme